jgi:hypothetical protein
MSAARVGIEKMAIGSGGWNLIISSMAKSRIVKIASLVMLGVKTIDHRCCIGEKIRFLMP